VLARAAVLALLFAGCPGQSGPKPEERVDPTSRNYAGPALPRGKVILKDAFGGRHAVEVEVAANHASVTRGLMWRTSLPDGQGMLFVFPGEEEHSFWMRNTLIPLDMLFLAEDGTLVGIVPHADPLTETSRTVGRPSHYVLEVPGGWCERAGVRTGSRAEIELPPGVDAGG